MRVTKAEKEAAKSIDLHDYLLRFHAEDFKMERSGSLRPKRDGFKSISIKPGANWFHEFDGSREKATSDNIDFMMLFYGLTFQEAVYALVRDPTAAVALAAPMSYENKPRKITLPTPDPYGQEMLITYLHGERKIPEDTVWWLQDQGLIYQDDTANLVFVNHEKTYYQVRATYDMYGDGRKILGSGRTKSDEFWYLAIGKGGAVYICEGALDAISLYELRSRQLGYYVSMGGVDNQQVIDRITRKDLRRVILCVDNDEAGRKCRNRNQELDVMIPPSPYKDWNEMLQAGVALPEYEEKGGEAYEEIDAD